MRGSDGIKAASISSLKLRWRDERSSDLSSLRHLHPHLLLYFAHIDSSSLITPSIFLSGWISSSFFLGSSPRQSEIENDRSACKIGMGLYSGR